MFHLDLRLRYPCGLHLCVVQVRCNCKKVSARQLVSKTHWFLCSTNGMSHHDRKLNSKLPRLVALQLHIGMDVLTIRCVFILLVTDRITRNFVRPSDLILRKS